jgi:hypothetical protein
MYSVPQKLRTGVTKGQSKVFETDSQANLRTCSYYVKTGKKLLLPQQDGKSKRHAILVSEHRSNNVKKQMQKTKNKNKKTTFISSSCEPF